MMRDRVDPAMKGPLGPERHVPALVEALGPELTGTILDKLTARERRFVEEYPKDLNGTAAAKRAGYSPRSAKDIAYEMLRKPRIVDALTAVVAKRSERTGLSRSWVLAQLADAHEKVKDKESASGITARLKCLELIGRHVDVRAFRLGLGFNGDPDDNDDRTIWDLSRLDDEEFETFERLLSKVTVIAPHAGGAGEAQPGAGPAAAGGASG